MTLNYGDLPVSVVLYRLCWVTTFFTMAVETPQMDSFSGTCAMFHVKHFFKKSNDFDPSPRLR